MANARLLSALEYLQIFKAHRHMGLSQDAKNAINKLNKEIRKAFRNAGRANVLPLTRNKMINKLASVARGARNNLRAAIRARENEKRKRENATHRRVSVPSLHVNYGKRENGRGPNVLVLSPGNNRGN
jgi:hypothetical protein